MKKFIFIFFVLTCSCKNFMKKSTASVSKDVKSSFPLWIKSPETIANTAAQSWELDSLQEWWKYFGSVHSVLGGTTSSGMGATLKEPNVTYLLSLYPAASYLAKNIIKKQIEKDANNLPYFFQGLDLSDEDTDDCFKDDSKEWCDFKDNIKLDSLSSQSITADMILENGPNKEMRKRLMHNIQDLGERLFLSLDDQIKIGSTGKHAPSYILDNVFIKTFTENSQNKEAEVLAWEETLTTIFIGSGYFIEVPSE